MRKTRHGDDLACEPPRLGGSTRPGMAFDRKCGLCVLINRPQRGKTGSRLRHVGIPVRPGGEGRPVIPHRRFIFCRRAAHAQRRPRIALDAASKHTIGGPGLDHPRGQNDRVEARAALAVQRDGGNELGQPRQQGGPPGRVAAAIEGVSGHDLIDDIYAPGR